MKATRVKRALMAAIMGLTVAVAAAPAAHAVGESSQCSVNWRNFSAKAGRNAWNYRTGPSSNYSSRGYLYRGDKLKVMCSKGRWSYSKLSQRSTSGIPKGTRGWVRDDGLVSLAG
ncbi:SH3 domain-containing protein [Streptomyces scabiei]|uniref:SH3 domain-containing protein n=1 Tax=Streptomyces scabiei TaxID=1930 RepID=UPI0033F14384